MQKQYIVYKLTNLITKEIYIGQTQNYKARILKYKSLNCKSQKFYWSYKKLDRFEIIEKRRKFDYLINSKINNLTIISFKENLNNKNYYLCKCDCGKEKSLYITEIVRSKVKSCGCLKKKK